MKRCFALAFLSIVLAGSQALSQSTPTQPRSDQASKPSLVSDGLPEPTATIDVASLSDLDKAIAAAKPGDHIVLADGVYTSTAAITINAQGTQPHPIVISAKSIGGVEINGTGSFTFGDQAAYVVLRGFKFTHAPEAVKISPAASHCRISRNLFELKLNARSPYLQVAGNDCEIDHNEFRNKNTEGQMLVVQGPGSSEMAQRTWIHHNYFHDFKSPPANNCSAIQIGLSGRSMSSGWSMTEHNLFINCAGENEGAICNKSSDNIYRFNTFGEGSTEFSVRHGNRCEVYANYFIGCEGLRFFGHDHKIYSNYFERCRPAIHIGNGDGIIPPAALTAHDRPVGVQVVFNTLVNNRTNVVMGGRTRGLGAGDIVFANNIIQGGPKAAAIGGPMENPIWQGNIVWGTEGGAGDIPAAGVSLVDPQLKQDASGAHRLQASGPAIGNAVGSYRYASIDLDGQNRPAKSDVGADQFSNAAVTNRILTPADVGPNAIENQRRVPTFPKTKAG